MTTRIALAFCLCCFFAALCYLQQLYNIKHIHYLFFDGIQSFWAFSDHKGDTYRCTFNMVGAAPWTELTLHKTQQIETSFCSRPPCVSHYRPLSVLGEGYRTKHQPGLQFCSVCEFTILPSRHTSLQTLCVHSFDEIIIITYIFFFYWALSFASAQSTLQA